MSEATEQPRPDETAAGEEDDLVFDLGSVLPAITDRRGILAALHERCAVSPANAVGSALLISVDGQAPMAREHGQPMANRVREEAYARVATGLAPSCEAGLLDEEVLLVLLEGLAPQAAADAMDAIRVDAGRIVLGARRFPVSYSAAVTGIRADDLPEAIVGRLSRALQRVMMGGGERTEVTD